MFNIFEKFAANSLDVEPQTDGKAERIEFHRAKVRNGPVTFKELTNGQARRAQQRAQKTAARKNYRREVKNYFEKQQLAAQVFAHLQMAGVIPYVTGRETPVAQQITSTSWLVQRFGTEVELDGAPSGFMSFRKADVVDALINAAKFYNSATGAGIKFPANFEPAISLAEAGDVIEGVNA